MQVGLASIFRVFRQRRGVEDLLAHQFEIAL